jgi:hypothetical protein
MTDVNDKASYLKRLRKNSNYRNLPCIGNISENPRSRRDCFENCGVVRDCIIYTADATLWDDAEWIKAIKDNDPDAFQTYLDARQAITNPLLAELDEHLAKERENLKLFQLPFWLARDKGTQRAFAGKILEEREKAYKVKTGNMQIWLPKSKVTVEDIDDVPEAMRILVGVV